MRKQRWMACTGLALLVTAMGAIAAEKLTGTILNKAVSCYRMADLEAAKHEAKASNKPIVWIASKPEFVAAPVSIEGTGSANATCHALAAFANRGVIVLQDAYTENHQGPAIVDHALHTPNPHYTPPTVVLLDPEATNVLKVITYEENFEARRETFKNTILELPKLMAPKQQAAAK